MDPQEELGKGPKKNPGGPRKGKREKKTQSNNGSYKEGHRGPRNKPQRGPWGEGAGKVLNRTMGVCERSPNRANGGL
jgi:hypothetical protein